MKKKTTAMVLVTLAKRQAFDLGEGTTTGGKVGCL
jgi:hypothetical protein